MLQNLTTQQLHSKLREILEKWPLYRDFAYLSADEMYNLPQIIFLHCDSCKNEQRWERQDPPQYPYNDRRGFSEARYRCRNCTSEETRFYFCWSGKKEAGYTFFKTGQYPPLEERIPTELEQQLKGNDLEFYKRALRCRNFNFGVAALAYLRRVVENRMNDLLDLIAEAACQAAYGAEELTNLEQVKTSRVFDEKVSYAAAILPPNLRPGGTNPFDLLHDLASEGLHGLSDGECIDVFDQSRTVFEHVFIELKVREANDKNFLDSLKELLKRKSKPASARPQNGAAE